VTVQDPNLIDVTSIDKQTGDVILTISDHLDWADTIEHQQILQRKINAYLAFIESGDLLQQFPDAKGPGVTVSIVFKFKPDARGAEVSRSSNQSSRVSGFSLAV